MLLYEVYDKSDDLSSASYTAAGRDATRGGIRGRKFGKPVSAAAGLSMRNIGTGIVRWSGIVLSLKKRVLWYIALRLPAVIVVIAIWFLSSQSILPQPKGILGFDKLQHLTAYLVLAGLIAFWFPWGKRKPVVSGSKGRPWWLVPLVLMVGIASAYGGIDEIHQYFVPGRDCNGWDWIADALGAVIGAGLALLVVKFRILK
jgi:VanZ family protein